MLDKDEKSQGAVVGGVEVKGYDPELAGINGTGESMFEMFMGIISQEPDAEEIKKKLTGNVHIVNS